jgi:hypothetical protein
MACSSSRDAHGTSYTIPEAPTVRTPRGQVRRGYPAVDVWWSRGVRKSDETIIIRQEYEDRSTADVLEITLGQLYDLIDALNKAVENL